ncbi:hypothetical protein DV452_001370 [Geotrichum candidum]|nr:hypothetical protein DV452_001370 [Geotrichum candidum]
MAISERTNSMSPTDQGPIKVPHFDHKAPPSPNHNEIQDDPHARSGGSAANRKRTARACDRCSTARTKCDGKQPCYRCLNLLIPCEYNRLIKKRGKGSELYPQNPRKVARKTQQNLPALASRSTEEAGKSRQETPSEAGELDLNSVKIKLSPSVEAATLARDRNVQTDNQPGEEFTSTQTEKPGHTVTDPYAALMRLADTSEQHHQLSENQRSTLSSIAGQSHPTMKRHHAEEQEYPRKGMAIPTIDFKARLTSKLLDRLMSYMRPWKNDNSHEYDLDEIIAYINVGIVSSASEFKGSSLRWWAIAWCMARVLKLNKEIPSLEEEAREERRRVWWTLFMIDRHLGLCYNRPCTLLDSESLELFFPISMEIWDSDSLLYPPEDDRNRRRGPQCKVIEVGLFGMYLPLMTLLGGIIDIHFLAMSPVLSGKEHVLKLLRESYRHRLSAFQFSLEEYYSQMSGPPNTLLQSWREYCQCFIQVFYILLEGFWDPTEMLDDIDVLLNDTRFTRCLANSIQASKHVQKILVLDPDLQVIPFFFGVQLLQAGFIPFCMSERYGSHTSTDVAQACEIFIRAHEVCIVTLSTQYQVHFRFIMRGVIRDMKHATVSVNDRIDSTRRRREIMSMYRWNAGGTGLAI